MADEPPETLPGVVGVPVRPVIPGLPDGGPEFLVPEGEEGEGRTPDEPLKRPEAPATLPGAPGHGPVF